MTIESVRRSLLARSYPIGTSHVMGALWVVMLTSCSGRQSARSDDFELQSERAFVRLPASLGGGSLELEQSAPALLRCYEVNVDPEAADYTQVQLQFVLDGGSLRARVVQQRQPLTESFSGCLEEVVTGWNLQPEVSGEGDILPIEFGPVGEQPPPEEPVPTEP